MHRYVFSEPGWRRPTFHVGDGSFDDTRAFDDEDWMNLDHRFVSWGFAYGDFRVDAFAGRAHLRQAMLPLWLLTIFFALAPTYWLRFL